MEVVVIGRQTEVVVIMLPKLTCRSSANFVSAGQKGLILKNEKYESLSIKRIRILRNNLKTAEITYFSKIV